MNGISFVNSRKAFDKEVNQRLNIQPTYNVCSVSHFSEYQTEKGYECMIRVGNEEFLSNACENRKPCETETAAENNAARYTYRQMSKCGWKLEEESEQKKLVIQNNCFDIPDVKKTKEGCLIIKNMGTTQLKAIFECSKYMSDEVLAMHFKDIIKIVASIIADNKFDPGDLYSYKTKLLRNDYTEGYSSRIDFKGSSYNSIGLMIDENQAEQSAAEVALRALGFLPHVGKNFLIQPYGGGLSRRLPGGIKIFKPYLFTSTILYDLLEAFMDAHNMNKPRYFIRNASLNVQDEFTIYGDTVQYVECLCSLFGKIFPSPIPHTKGIALQLAANEAINHFYIDRILQRFELRKCLHINRFEFSQGARTIYRSRPSILKGWIWPKFFGPDEYKDSRCDDELIQASRYNNIIQHNWPDRKYINKLIRQELGTNCTFRGTNFMDIEDLCVASVDSKNPNLYIVGNAEFSIKILFKGGRVYSTQRKSHIPVKPGHNIKKLRCDRRLSLPSLEVHLKAIDCHDLYFLNPPNPVVTSCGAVALFHDFNASPRDIYVLLVKRTTGTSFESKARRLMLLLHSLITPNSSVTVTPEECVEGIGKWYYKEVKLLSEMTMESLHELMSTTLTYDTRWNELVGSGELPAPLRKIKELCQNELKRRDVEESPKEEVAETWELPRSEFATKFSTIGIFTEDSTFCALRACAEVGAKIRLADIDTCKTVDIPDMTDTHHRGGVSRYYIWNGIWQEGKEALIRRKADCPEDIELMKEYQLVQNPKTEHGMNRYRYPFNQRLYMYGSATEQMYLMQNIRYVNLDGTRTRFIDELKYKISEKEMKRSIHYWQLEDKEADTSADQVGSSEVAMDDVSANNSIIDNKLNNSTANTSADTSGEYANTSATDKDKDKDKDKGNDKQKDQKNDGKNLPTSYLPGGADFVSYRHSLHRLCTLKDLPKPVYSIKRVGALFRGACFIGKTRVLMKKLSPTEKLAGDRAAYAALRSYGYLRYTPFDACLKKVQPKEPKEEVSFDTAIKKLKEKVQASDVDVPAKKCDKNVEVIEIDGNDMPEKKSEKKIEVIEIDNSDDEKSCAGETELEKASEEDGEKREESETELEKASEEDGEKREESDSEEVVIDGQVFKVLNEWTTSDGEEEKEKEEEIEEVEERDVKEDNDTFVENEMEITKEEAREEDKNTEEKDVEEKDVEEKLCEEKSSKKRVCQWADDDDIPADDLGLDDKIKTDKRERKNERKRIKMSDTVVNEEPSNEWGKHKDVKGFKKARIDRGFDFLFPGKHAKNQLRATGSVTPETPETPVKDKKIQKSPSTLGTPSTPGKPSMKCVSYLTPDGPKTIMKKGKVPPLPARDAYRQQCIWMKVDEAVDVCPMLMKISHTSEFKKQLTKLVDEANRYMKSKVPDVTVNTTLLSK